MLDQPMNARNQPSIGKAVRRLLTSRVKARTAPRRNVVPALIAYGDVPSARRAMARVTDLVHNKRRNCDLQPMLWRLDQLERPRWREMALRDAARASVLVLAMPAGAALCRKTESWIAALLARKRGARLTVLALIGESEAWTITLDQPDAATTAVAAKARGSATTAVEVFASRVRTKAAACAA